MEINCFVYAGTTEVLAICDMEYINTITEAPKLICKLKQQQEGNWEFLIHNTDRYTFNNLLKKFNNKIYLRMPDKQGYSLT